MRADIVHESWRLLAYIAEPAARSLALGCFVAAALGALRVKSVAAKLTAWRGVLVAALAMPLVALAMPGIPLAVPVPGFVAAGDAPAAKFAAPAPVGAQQVATRTTSSEVVYTISAEPAKPGAAHHKRATAIVSHPASARATEIAAKMVLIAPASAKPVAVAEAPAKPAPAPARREIPWAPLAAGIYLAVALFLLVRVAIGMRFGERLRRAAAPIEDREALAILSAASQAAGLRAAPVLAESELLSVPLALGVRRPAILFPAEWRTWAATELEAVMVHEVSHVERRDALVQRVALIHRGIFWFSPLAWWLDRHLADLAEHASDEAALANGADRTRYAETLLGFFTALEGAPQRVWWHGVSMAKAGQAEKRVDRILAWRGAVSNRIKTSLAVLLAAVAAPALVLTAAVHPTIYNFQGPTTMPPPQTAAAPVSPAPPAQRAPAAAPTPVPPADVSVVAVPSVAPAPEAMPAMPPEPSVTPVAPMALVAPMPAVAPAPPAPWGNESMGLPEGWPEPQMSSEQREQFQREREALASVKAQMSAAKVQLKEAKKQLSSSNTKAQLDAERSAMASYRAAEASYRAEMGKYRALVAQAREVAEKSGERYRILGNWDSGPRFVIVTHGSEGVTMSGSEEDAEHAKALRSKIPGDFIWFERDEKSYIIRDAATVDRAKKLWAPEEELGRKQEALGKQQEALGRQQEELGEKMEEVRVKIPDLTAQLQEVMAKAKQLSQNGGTQEEIGDLQSEIGDLQSRVGEVQSDAGRQQGEIGRKQGELGRQQGELGRQQGELGRQQGELARQANREMRSLLDEAITKGTAQPE